MGVTAREEGFDRLVEPFRAELLAYCYRMLGSAHDAEDLVQDTYLRAWRTREQYDDTRSSLRTWLFTVTAEGISRNSVFQGSEVFAAFGLAAGLDAQNAGQR